MLYENNGVCQKSGFSVVPINIKWKLDMYMDDFIRQANKEIPNNIKNDYILGFSFGAYITAVLSKRKRQKDLFFVPCHHILKMI